MHIYYLLRDLILFTHFNLEILHCINVVFIYFIHMKNISFNTKTRLKSNPASFTVALKFSRRKKFAPSSKKKYSMEFDILVFGVGLLVEKCFERRMSQSRNLDNRHLRLNTHSAYRLGKPCKV